MKCMLCIFYTEGEGKLHSFYLKITLCFLLPPSFSFKIMQPFYFCMLQSLYKWKIYNTSSFCEADDWNMDPGILASI